MQEVIERELRPGGAFRGAILTTGSAGTIACGDYLKQAFPGCKVGASEALQCPTLLENGFGAHRIEGIGDKHVPWIHNVMNSDLVTAIDDEAVVSLARLFNEKAGRTYLVQQGVPQTIVEQLDLLGFSGIANLLSAIKFARYYEVGDGDLVLTVLTDSMELYGSRLKEMHAEHGDYSERDAASHFARYLLGENTENLLELSQRERRRIHNLKYYTWVEQQGRTYEEILTQREDPTYWSGVQGQVEQIDALIDGFNKEVGLAG
jgi:hypothetical protein